MTYYVDEAVGASQEIKPQGLAKYLSRALHEPAVPLKKIFKGGGSWRGPDKDEYRLYSSSFEDCGLGCTHQAAGISMAATFGPKWQIRPGFDEVLRDVAASLPTRQIKLILWIRSNVVKMAMGSHGQKGRLSEAKLATKGDKVKDYDAARVKTEVDVVAFLAKCDHNVERNADLERLAARTESLGLSWLVAYYEAFQLDTPGEMAKVRAHLGFPPDHSPANVVSLSKKITSDDLRDTIINFKELENALEKSTNATSKCILKLLRATKPAVFAPCGNHKTTATATQ